MQAPRVIHRALLLSALALAACGKDEAPSGVIPREKFVAANVAVRSLPSDATVEQRTAALRKHGVTDRQLKAWVTVQARQPEVLAKAWEEIAFKLDSMGGAVPPTPVTPVPDAAVPAPPPARPAPLQGRPDSVRTTPPSRRPPGRAPKPGRPTQKMQ